MNKPKPTSAVPPVPRTVYIDGMTPQAVRFWNIALPTGAVLFATCVVLLARLAIGHW